MKTIFITIILSFFSIVVFAQAGILDSTFNADGIAIIPIGGGINSANSIVIQPDGKIVEAGRFNYQKFAVVRVNANGSVDSSFGTDGMVLTTVGSDVSGAYSVGLQPDGKILVAGYAFLNYGNEGFALVRYVANGDLDTTFGTNGIVITDFGSQSDQATSLCLQPDGKIVVGGFSEKDTLYQDNADFALVRYNNDGTLDSAFGLNGKVTTSIDSDVDRSSSMLLQADGKIVLAGSSYHTPFDGNNFALVRYNTGGTVDDNFGVNGIVTTDFGGNNDFAKAIALQSDGKFVVAGSGSEGYGYAWTWEVARYTSDGTLDLGFGSNGTNTFFGSQDDYQGASSIVIQPDEKMLVAGIRPGSFGNADFALVRLNTNGELDNSFGTNGSVITDLAFNNDDLATAIALQGDEKIVVAGYSGEVSSYDFALVRYLSDLNVGILNFTFSQISPLIYPNPIQQTEELEYMLTTDQVLTISLCDINGRVVRNFLTKQNRIAGMHKEELNMENLSAGNYLLTISNGEKSISIHLTK